MGALEILFIIIIITEYQLLDNSDTQQQCQQKLENNSFATTLVKRNNICSKQVFILCAVFLYFLFFRIRALFLITCNNLVI